MNEAVIVKHQVSGRTKRISAAAVDLMAERGWLVEGAGGADKPSTSPKKKKTDESAVSDNQEADEDSAPETKESN